MSTATWFRPESTKHLDPLPHHAYSGSAKHAYSLMRAIRHLSDPKHRRHLDGLEGETSQEIARRTGRDAQGFFVPLDLEVRVVGTIDATLGAGGIATMLRTDQLIDVLRRKMVTAQLGAKTITVTGGAAKVPRIQTGSNVAWVAEGVAPAASSPAIDSVSFTGKTVTAWTDLTRLLISSSPDAEPIIIGDITSAIAQELDRVALNGSGTGAEPRGLAQNSAITTFAMGANGLAPTRAAAIAIELALSNALGDAGADAKPAWVTTPAVRAKMRSVEVSTGGGRYLWPDDSDTILNKPAVATTSLPDNLVKGSSGAVCSALLYGDWSQLQIATWGAVDVLVDPFRYSTSGIVRVALFLDADVQARQNAAFQRCLDILAA